MPTILFNDFWMTVNAMLAFLAVLLGYFFLRSASPTLKVLFGISWLLFLPNTIYIFTDLQHLVSQWRQVTPAVDPLLILQYTVLQIIGVVTFILGFRPFEKIINYFSVLKKKKLQVTVAFNFLIAFGMVLGRVERINSWEVVSNPIRVLVSSFHVLTSLQLLGLTLLFGVVCNIIYFLFRDPVIHTTRKNFRKLSGKLQKFLD
ncbi:MAG: DUF1361 domain-containing protein [Candidatus Levyibacteriota bacterium]